MARRQQEKSQQTREELMASAVTLFGRKGFVNTSIAEITKGAGYAKGNFYRYWKSKDDLFLAIMKERMGAYRRARQGALARADSLETVLNVLLDFLETIIDDENWSKIFLEFTIHASRSDGLREELNSGEHRLSPDLFAELIGPHKTSSFSPKKLGGLTTALFEGYLIQSILGMGVLDRQDLRKAILMLALADGDAATGEAEDE